MESIFFLYKGESSEKRPGLELFWWRSLTFFILYLIATIVFFNLRNYHISILQWFVTAVLKIALLIVSVYHFSLGMMFKKLQYKIADDALEISLFPFDLKIPFSEIEEVKEASGETEIKRVYGYNKEVPQLIHYVGQIGMFKASGTGNILICATLNSLKKPNGLIVLKIKGGRVYGISPAPLQEFMKIMQEKLKVVTNKNVGVT
jgi:hypothetical protein